MTLRRIKPLSFPGVEPAAVTGAKPILRWVAPTDLYVDGFAWNRMKPPIVVEADGKLHVVDGQHTAIAVASLALPELPIFVVEAVSLDERARAFVGHNTDRITVTPIAIYNALRAAGDPDALDVERVCARAGVRIREFTMTSAIAEGDTKAIGLVRQLIKRRGVIKARKVLESLSKARLKPIPGGAITAAENIICIERPGTEPEALAAVIRMDGENGLAKARAKAAGERTQFWRVLMGRWLRRLDQEAAPL